MSERSFVVVTFAGEVIRVRMLRDPRMVPGLTQVERERSPRADVRVLTARSWGELVEAHPQLFDQDEDAHTIRSLFDYWQRACGHEQAKLTDDRRRKIRARLREGYTVANIQRAIDGAAAAPYVVDGQRLPTGHPRQRFDDVELICRKGSKLEAFMALAPEPGDDGASLEQKLVGS